VTAKIGGSSRPCTNRQNTSAARLGASAAIAVGTTRRNIAVTMTRLRPSESATAPVKGAMSATAKVEALTVRLTSAGLAAKVCASSGSRACVV
jgi:hypothetical protein